MARKTNKKKNKIPYVKNELMNDSNDQMLSDVLREFENSVLSTESEGGLLLSVSLYKRFYNQLLPWEYGNLMNAWGEFVRDPKEESSMSFRKTVEYIVQRCTTGAEV